MSQTKGGWITAALNLSLGTIARKLNPKTQKAKFCRPRSETKTNTCLSKLKQRSWSCRWRKKRALFVLGRKALWLWLEGARFHCYTTLTPETDWEALISEQMCKIMTGLRKRREERKEGRNGEGQKQCSSEQKKGGGRTGLKFITGREKKR